METSLFSIFFSEFGRAIVWFPAWWYTAGLKFTVSRLAASIKSMSRLLGFDVWSKNLFVPMYGDASMSGRAISFMLRLFMTVVLGLVLLFWIIVMFAFGLLYLLILPVSMIGILAQIIFLFSA